MSHTDLAVIESTASPCENAGALASAAPRHKLDLDKLFREHRRHLLRFVMRYVRSEADAEDVVQNTFIEALRSADRYAGLAKPSTWLFGIALNLARTRVRSNHADKYTEVDESFMEQLVDDRADPARLIELRQITGKLEILLDSLPTDVRATFDAVLDGDSTYEAAAEKLAIPVGTVRSRVARVRATVRSHFN
jgi:RNA polymerase sigma-70 factor (ECF subfamily)